jgi:hypothetical protein
VFSLANSFKSILVCVFVAGGIIGSSAPPSAASPRMSNCRSGVCTRVVLNHDDGSEDLCFVSNFGNTAAIAYVAVSPWSNGGVATLGPIILGVLNERKVFAWSPRGHDWRKYVCQVVSVQ